VAPSADVAKTAAITAIAAHWDIFIRFGGSVLDTQFTQWVSTMKVECAERVDFARLLFWLQSATENLKSQIVSRV